MFAGRRFAVLGLGRNRACRRRALSRRWGADVVAWDDAQPASHADRPISRPADRTTSLRALVLSPGIPHPMPAPHPVVARPRRLGVPILVGRRNAVSRRPSVGRAAHFVGITGTNGKSTTTALLAPSSGGAGGSRCRRQLGAGARLWRSLADAGLYVLEMSSYMLERLATLRFDVASCSISAPDHLDRHGDMAGYIAAKAWIFASADAADDLRVVGIDDDPARRDGQTSAGADVAAGARPRRATTPADAWWTACCATRAA